MNITIEQSEEFKEICSEFLSDVLDLDGDTVLITVHSELSDFLFSGNPPFNLREESISNAIDLWDAWVIRKIFQIYQIQITNTNINLLQLFRQIEERKNIH